MVIFDSLISSAAPGGSENCVEDSNLIQIPPTLDREHAEKYFDSFCREYEPIGPTELAIVRDLARQTAAMDRWHEATGAVERQAVRSLPQLAQAVGVEINLPDVVFASAMTCDAADRCERHDLSRTRAFYRALTRLEELQAKRLGRASDELQMPPSFVDEAACEAYLADRLRKGLQRCAKCGTAEGYLFPARRCWECAGCSSQQGFRTGTVMARSSISLWKWFEAVRWLIWRPTVGIPELGSKIDLKRLATVREMARRIRSAFASERASSLLAGLDSYFAR